MCSFCLKFKVYLGILQVLPQRQHVYSKCILSDNRHPAPDNVQCLRICINCLGKDARRIHRANKEWLTALIWQRFSSPMVSKSVIPWVHELWRRKNGVCRREYDREDSKRKEKNRSLPTECFLNNSSVASHSCEENIGFAEKRDHISIKSKAF